MRLSPFPNACIYRSHLRFDSRLFCFGMEDAHEQGRPETYDGQNEIHRERFGPILSMRFMKGNMLLSPGDSEAFMHRERNEKRCNTNKYANEKEKKEGRRCSHDAGEAYSSPSASMARQYPPSSTTNVVHDSRRSQSSNANLLGRGNTKMNEDQNRSTLSRTCFPVRSASAWTQRE
jgi:hypothetical protein